jgi:hypothetical protein
MAAADVGLGEIGRELGGTRWMLRPARFTAHRADDIQLGECVGEAGVGGAYSASVDGEPNMPTAASNDSASLDRCAARRWNS